MPGNLPKFSAEKALPTTCVPQLAILEYSNIQVLLIEDNLAEARLFREILQDAWATEFGLVHFQRLGEAIIGLNYTRFDIALLDLTLPDSNGLESLDALIHHAPSLPIVVLTNTNDDYLGYFQERKYPRIRGKSEYPTWVIQDFALKTVQLSSSVV